MVVVAVVVVLLLAGAQLLAHLGGPAATWLVAVASLLGMVVARRAGLTWAELGLARDRWRAGARYGLAAAGLVVAAVAVVAALPLTRAAFDDERYQFGFAHALLVALVLVPLRTVVPEELAFRGVLLAVFRRAYGTRIAVIVSSLLFGLWHVSSSLHLAQDNKAVGGPLGSGAAGQALGVVGAVLATTAVGFVFCWLRLRSDSLLAPIGLHWALNGAGVLAVSAVWSLTR